MDRTPRMRMGQLNLQGSEAATAEIERFARELELDLVLIQEQFGKGMGHAGQFKETPKAGVLVCNRHVTVTALEHLSNEHCAVAQVEYGGTSFIAISAYFQYRDDIATP